MQKNYLEQLQTFSKTNSKASLPLFDFHLHTSWTDGAQTSKEMYDQAVSEGLEFVLFSEHARQTSEDWFFDFAKEIRNLPQTPCKPLVGVEAKVADFNGNLDTTEKIMETCDLVMASVHRFPGEKGIVKGFAEVDPKEAVDIEFQLANAVLDNSHMDILGHPFGMSFRRFHVIPEDDKIRQLIKKAARNKKAFEVNVHYHPDPWKLIRWCQEEGTLVSLGSNAHSTKQVGKIIRVLSGDEAAWKPS